MRRNGFVNHALTGALFLGGLWFAFHMPTLTSAAKADVWPIWALVAVFAIGVLGGPVLMLLFGGDEIFGCLGVVVALLLGLGFAYLAVRVWAAPDLRDTFRLCGAALGPILLYAGIRLALWLAERRPDRAGSGL
jgi:hypothetical protein